jgi:glutamyl-tRNA synthetase
MAESIRVRFAPSPTGFLHIGGARTALFNWLYARACGGKFVLRIEDTDQQRNSTEAVEVILQGLRWLGLDWDEGPESSDPNQPSRGQHGPYFQSARSGLYKKHVDVLKASGQAYDRDGAVYFRMPKVPITIPDQIVGDVIRPLTDREQEDPDWVLVRSDGAPVFHLVNVVDDLEMGITHVIRGEDHLVNTAKHIALFHALGVKPPIYAHIPLILNEDGSKMSKRDQGAFLSNYQEAGFTPEALVNYLALLGWSSPNGQEFLSVSNLIEAFDLSRVHRSAARFDVKKLEALHFEHTRTMAPPLYVERALPFFQKAGFDLSKHPDTYVAAALETTREKGKLFSDLAVFAGFYFVADAELRMDPAATAKAFTQEAKPLLEALREVYSTTTPFTATLLEEALKHLAKSRNVKAGALVQPCRVACTGSLVGPSLYHLLEVLGRDSVLCRLARAIDSIALD